MWWIQSTVTHSARGAHGPRQVTTGVAEMSLHVS